MSRSTLRSGGVLRRVLFYLRRHIPLLLLSLLLAVVSTLLMLSVPLLVGDAIDLCVGKGRVDFDGIRPILLRVLLFVLLSAVAQWLMSLVNNRITYRVAQNVRNDACRKIQTLPLSYLDSHPVGDLVSRVIADVEQFTEGLLLGFTQLFSGIVTIVGTLVFMLRIHVGIALLVVLLTPLSLFVARFIASRTHHLFTEQAKARGTQTAYIDEMVGNAELLHAFSREKLAATLFDEGNDALNKISVRATFFSSLVNPSTRFVNNVIYAVTCLCGAFAACAPFLGGALTVGALSGLLSYATQYTKPFNEISGVVTELQNSLVCAGRVFELLDTNSESADPEQDPPMSAQRGEVDICDISFSYTPTRPLIEGFTLHVEPGQRVAIVGPTGCGKTTLINLLMRFYEPCSGAISVDGTDISSMKRHTLRERYGMVLQDTFLFEGTVRDNIRMGDPEGTDEAVEAAARAAHAHGFISRLSDGYDTVIRENGDNLSQGQKQLLCIARVMLALPPMLILDEATSSIDTRTEIKIQKAFKEMMRGRTSFIVAHRLSTIKEADIIVVMRSGNVVEQGTHEELLKKDGFYAHLYNSQFERSM